MNPCQWLLPPPDGSPPETEAFTCGEAAVAQVTVKTKITHAKVWLCPAHKREHNVSFAAARTTRKSA